MADHLRVDLDLLAQTASSLAQLRDEFARSSDIADGYAAAIGSGTVNDAMHDFATNWEAHRAKLLESIESIQKMVDTSNQTYRDADGKLAQAATPQSRGPR